MFLQVFYSFNFNIIVIENFYKKCKMLDMSRFVLIKKGLKKKNYLKKLWKIRKNKTK